MSIGAWMLGRLRPVHLRLVGAELQRHAAARSRSAARSASWAPSSGSSSPSYTGVLLSATALPFWSDARLMGALFLASGASTGMAAISAAPVPDRAAAAEPGTGKVKHADRYAMIVELVVLALFLGLLGSAAAPAHDRPLRAALLGRPGRRWASMRPARCSTWSGTAREGAGRRCRPCSCWSAASSSATSS